MLRNRAVALILGCTVSTLTFALGLGPLQSSSHLNEPFAGRIEILGATPEDFDAIKISLASIEQFERAGIDLTPVLYNLRFTVDDSGDGAFIAVTSKDSIREPYLNFLLEVNWLKGRLVREYTVLLDPPLYDADRRRMATPAPTLAATPAPSAAIVPSATPLSRQATTAGDYVAGTVVGPVGATDTLWSIASAHRPDESVTVQQMMLALLRANPEAFGESNVNLLRRGAVLRLPERGELAAVPAREAFAEVLRQHQLWETYRGQVASAPATQPVGAPAGGRAADSAERAVDGSRLELVAPGGADGGGAPGSASGGTGSDLLREEIDARSQQNADLEGKLVELEEIVDILQRQVNIKDEELAALQARLAELGIEHGDIAALSGDNTAVDEPADTATDSGVDTTATDATEGGEIATATDAEAMAAEDVSDTEATDTSDEEAVDDGGAESVEESVPDDEIEMAAGATPPVTQTPAARGFPANLVPEHIAAMVPGGSLTVLGGAAALILGLFVAIVVALSRRRGAGKAPPEDAEVAARTATVTAATAAAASVVEEDEEGSEAPTELGAETESPTEFDPSATIEAEADDAAVTDVPAAAVTELPTREDEEDPLEEINVYLAYERFDQAEELVKRVIEQYPDRHEYKLRLLEVYYSANDRSAYETAARQLHEAVGEDDTLWPSAVAMWTEMSPERELFAAGGDSEASSAPQEVKSFVDITGDTIGETEVGADTVAHAPGGDDDGLDFDLGADDGDADEAVLDLTASAGDDAVLDITSGGDEPDEGTFDVSNAAAGDDDVLDVSGGGADDGVLDLTDAEDVDDGAMLDITAAAEDILDLTGSSDDDVLDLTGSGDTGAELGADDGVLDITAGEADMLEIGSNTAGGVFDLDSLEDTHVAGSDLLDVTRTGDISSVEDDDLLNVTSPGMRAQEEPPALDDDALEIEDLSAGDTGDVGLDFDISESVAPAFDTDGGDEGILDLTGAGSDGGEELIDFDIGGLAQDDGDQALPTLDTEGETMVDADNDTLDMGAALTAESGSDGLDFDLGVGSTEEVGDDSSVDALSIEESEDDDGRLEITLSSLDAPSTDGELSLQGDELDALALDAPDAGEFDIALDGTVDMDSIAGADTIDMGSLSLDRDDAKDEPGLDVLEIGEGNEESHLDTMALELEEPMDLEVEDERTVVMPLDRDVERQSDSDEADTKLNLAKAYIELGDAEGARSILDEVVNDGNEAQKAEARALLGQLSG
ncbi:MAG: FimV/HubP family polar landmark protein [Gammaproteobacteria bacterium]